MNSLKWFQSAATLVPAILLIAPVARAGEHSTPPSIVTRYCSGCHGIDGKSQLPYIPRLAGLNADYAARKLATFKTGASAPVDEALNHFARMGSGNKNDDFTPEANAHMVGTANAISDRDIKAASQWYAAQQPAPGKNAKGKTIEEGRSLYINGLQSRRIPACQACHGPEAQGSAVAPRLAGQNAAYVLGHLALYRVGDRAQSPMTDVARSLENDQARALAAYLQSR